MDASQTKQKQIAGEKSWTCVSQVSSPPNAAVVFIQITTQLNKVSMLLTMLSVLRMSKTMDLNSLTKNYKMPPHTSNMTISNNLSNG